MIRPESSTATTRSMVACPVSVSNSTTTMWVPNGKVAPFWEWSDRPASSSSAAVAISAHDRATAGVPATWNAPRSRSSTTSPGAASSRSAAVSRARSTSFSEASAMADPAICTERDPPVVDPDGMDSVSPWNTSIESRGTPNRSATIIAQVVWCPVPMGVAPVDASTVPSLRSRTSPYSLPPKPVIST